MGVLGVDLLKDLVVRIDYAAQTIEFLKRSTFTPPAGAMDLPLTPSDRGYLVEAAVKTGDAAARPVPHRYRQQRRVRAEPPLQDRHPELSFRRIARNGMDGIGGTLLTSEAICPTLSLGDIHVDGPLVDLDQASQGVEADIDGIIGNETWRRFDLVFNLPDNELYLQKNAHFSEPFSYVTAGMNVLASGSNHETLTVREVLPGSAGQRAGFEKGRCASLAKGAGRRAMTIANVYPRLHREGTCHFTVQRGAQKLPLLLQLKNP